MSAVDSVRWPEEYAPTRSGVHVRNELQARIAPDVAFAWLVRAARWPEWYPNAADIQFLDGNPPDLALGTVFRWKTFGMTITSRVLELVPGERIAWDAHAFGIHAYHAWVFKKTESGCFLLTEETQNGWLARLGKLLMPNRMLKFHQIWLENLAARAQSGNPT